MWITKYFKSSSTPEETFKKPTNLHELLAEKLKQRSGLDKLFFNHSSKGLSGLALFSSIYMNVAIRRSVMLYEAFLASSVGVGIFTCTTNYLTLYGAVQQPLLEGNLNCVTCAVTKGSFLQALTAAISPGILSLALAWIISDRYQTGNMPTPTFPIDKEMKDYVKKIYPAIKKAGKGMVMFQALCGALVAYKQYRISSELLDSVSEEEYTTLWQHSFHLLDGAKG